MNSHDRLKAAGLTPTMDCERAYRLGLEDAERYRHALQEIALIPSMRPNMVHARKIARAALEGK